MKVVAIMPAYKEAPRIAQAVAGVLPLISQVIVVDDGSRDETAERARAAGAIVLCHAVNRGQGAALKTGTVAALQMGAEAIVHVDADGQHDPESLPRLLAPIMSGETDVTFGSRFLEAPVADVPAARRLLLRGISLFNAYALGIPRRMTDPQSGLRAMRADVARSLNFTQDRFAHCSEILRLVTHSHWRWQEVPTRIRYTADSLAKGQKPTDALKIVWQLLLGSFQR